MSMRNLRRMAGWLLAAIGLAGLKLGAATAPTVDTEVEFTAAYTEDFEVDGTLSAPVWLKAEPIGQMRDNRYPQVDLPRRADLRFAYSKTALYFGGTVWQDLSTAVVKWDQHDLPIWGDDNVELVLFLAEDDGNHVYQLIINPLGSLADIRDGNLNWNAEGIVIRTQRFDDRWTIEVKLPFAALAMERPAPGDFIAARFCRWLHDGKLCHGSVPILINTGNEQRGRFAKLQFAEPTGAGAAELIAEGRAYKADAFRRKFYRRYEQLLTAFTVLAGQAAAFGATPHPFYRQARAVVDAFQARLTAFQTRHASSLAAQRPVPNAEAEALLAAWSAVETETDRLAYAMWPTSPWEIGSPTALPPADAPLMPAAIAFEQAGNEREALCFNLHGLLCGARLDLRLWPETLDRPGSPYLASDNFEVYVEPFVDIEGETVTMPLVRAPGNIVTVSPGRTVRVWIVFRSRGVQAGEYLTELKLKPLTGVEVKCRTLPLKAKVWNFDLPETRDWPLRSFFWGSFAFHNDEVPLMELMHEYHVTHAWTQFHRYQYGMYGEKGYWKAPKQGTAKVDPDHDFDDEVALHGNQAFLERAKALGMRFVIGWGTPRSLAWFQTMTKRFRDLGFEYEDFVYKGLLADEFVQTDIPTWAKRRAEVWNWNTNLFFQATLLSTPPPTGPSYEAIEAAGLPKFYRNWTVIRSLIKEPGRGQQILASLRRHGCKIWAYECSHFMHKQDILDYYRLYPWEARFEGLDGIAFWTIYSPNRDGWDSRDGFDDGVCWRGLDTKPVPTKQLEAVREGLEDIAYMDRLEREIARLRAQGKATAAAERLLAERSEIFKAHDQSRLDAWRLAVGRMIDEMTRQ